MVFFSVLNLDLNVLLAKSKDHGQTEHYAAFVCTVYIGLNINR